MPIYEYLCSSCGFQKEYLQKVSDPRFSVCPECSKETFGKMLTAAGFQLKGSGWYATDFKNSGAKPVAKNAGEGGSADNAAGKTAAAGEGKSEVKSEVKSEGKSEGKSEAKSGTPPAAAPAAPASTAKAA